MGTLRIVRLGLALVLLSTSSLMGGCGGGSGKGGECRDACEHICNVCGECEDEEIEDCVDSCKDDSSNDERECILDTTSCDDLLDCFN